MFDSMGGDRRVKEKDNIYAKLIGEPPGMVMAGCPKLRAWVSQLGQNLRVASMACWYLPAHANSDMAIPGFSEAAKSHSAIAI